MARGQQGPPKANNRIPRPCAIPPPLPTWCVQGQYDKALNDIYAALALDQDDVNALHLLSKIDYELGDYEQALKTLNRLIDIHKVLRPRPCGGGGPSFEVSGASRGTVVCSPCPQREGVGGGGGPLGVCTLFSESWAPNRLADMDTIQFKPISNPPLPHTHITQTSRTTLFAEALNPMLQSVYLHDQPPECHGMGRPFPFLPFFFFGFCRTTCPNVLSTISIQRIVADMPRASGRDTGSQ